jgi:D-lactate dehydrogenase (cytochrome)
MQALCAENGGAGFRFAEQPEDRTRLWKARHDNYYATFAYAPGRKGMSTDACVPISELAACILETEADIEQTGFLAPIAGNVGDGAFHLRRRPSIPELGGLLVRRCELGDSGAVG